MSTRGIFCRTIYKSLFYNFSSLICGEMSTAVEIMQAGMGCWFTGGFNGAEKDANYEKFFSDNIVWENNLGYTAATLLPFEGTFSGKEGFWHMMEMFNALEWKDLQPAFIAGPSDDKAICVLDGFIAARGTDKVTDKRVQCLVQWTIKDGKVVNIKDYGADIQAINAVFA